ncbi:serine/threonine-protein phosphatase [Mycoplasmatota bacterium]|nr:serine/threonine-protein phosphatase [Mycoplasmatota bacterium]
MNDLFVEIDYASINKYKETLCGDHIELINDENNQILVLADGLGSGVKANILSTLTSKIISTMIANGMSLSDCIETIANTLPVCKVREIAYSTFSVLRFIHSNEVEIIQFDNPFIILIREGELYEFHKTEMQISGKKIFYSHIKIKENDLFISMSDGCVHAGVGKERNFGWRREEIIDYMKAFYHSELTSKTLVKILLDQCMKLYDDKPGDDTTVAVARVIKREPTHVMIGPPKNPSDLKRMMSIFFSKEGKKIVCGGTTSELVAHYLKKDLKPSLKYIDQDIPPTAEIEGIDLVTEGVITINKVLDYTRDYLNHNVKHKSWGYKKDGASLLTRKLIEESTDIHFYVGQAINPAHQNPDLPINFNIKMQLVNRLTEALKQIGKIVKINYY